MSLKLRDSAIAALKVIRFDHRDCERMADAVLAIPEIQRALAITAAVDAEPLRDVIDGMVRNGDWQTGDADGHNRLLARLRATGDPEERDPVKPTKEPRP